MNFKPIIWFSELKREDASIVGGKGLNLCFLYDLKLPVPPGFIITIHTYKYFLDSTGIQNAIFEMLNSLDVNNPIMLEETSRKIKEIIIDARVPDEIKDVVIEAYEDLNVNRMVSKALAKDVLNSLVKSGRELPFVAVRSSIPLEDSQNLSFAGQHNTYLNVRGREEVLLSVQKCWASLFNVAAILYRKKNNISLDNLSIAVVVQKMVQSEKSGFMFSINPVTNDEKEIVIEAVFGLGEVMANGEIKPDNYIINKDSLIIKSLNVNKQEYGIFKDLYNGKNVKNIFTAEKGNKQKLSNEEIINLAKYSLDIEKEYKRAMDSVWAIENNKIFILQTKPLISFKKPEDKTEENLDNQTQENKLEIKQEVKEESKQEILDTIKQDNIVSSTKITMHLVLSELLYTEMKKYPQIKWEEFALQNIIEKIILLNASDNKNELLELLNKERQKNVYS